MVCLIFPYGFLMDSKHSCQSLDALNAGERSRTMDHSSVVYEKYYSPTHIARDFQSIYFGTPKQEELIRSIASMNISRDRHAPTELNGKQLN